jgi:hypothetical protein
VLLGYVGRYTDLRDGLIGLAATESLTRDRHVDLVLVDVDTEATFAAVVLVEQVV